MIDANGIDRVVFFSTSLTLRGISLTGGSVGTPDPMTGFIGGAIVSSGGSSLTISDGTVFGNTADGGGGGISAAGPLALTNVTVSGNTTTDSPGGGIEAGGTSMALDHVTVTDNRSLVNNAAQTEVAGGIHTTAPTATAHNSLIAGNTDASVDYDAPDCQGAITSLGGNVIGTVTSECTFAATLTDSVGSPALLAPLGDNGGFSQTHALLSGSPALDRGVADCAPTDQRGYPRPFPAGGSCDSGSYELFACAGTPLNQPGPFLGCPQPSQTKAATTRKKCKRKKRKTRSAAAAKRCKRKKQRRH